MISVTRHDRQMSYDSHDMTERHRDGSISWMYVLSFTRCTYHIIDIFLTAQTSYLQVGWTMLEMLVLRCTSLVIAQFGCVVCGVWYVVCEVWCLV